MLKIKSALLLAILVFGASACVKKYPKYNVEIDVLEPGATIALGQVRTHPAGTETVWGVKLWRTYEPGQHELEAGSYFYRLTFKDGRTEQGLIAILDDSKVILK